MHGRVQVQECGLERELGRSEVERLEARREDVVVLSGARGGALMGEDGAVTSGTRSNGDSR